MLVHTARSRNWSGCPRAVQPATDARLTQPVRRAGATRRGDLAFVAEVAPTPPAVAPVAGLVNVANIADGGIVADAPTIVDLPPPQKTIWRR